ncbi:hypothetical protein BY458DRAFT_515404 [Sporodiniella umbellata]|nr:hypothetical protein BY458DRAFT_515404 [Sporodiniella umbellata]
MSEHSVHLFPFSVEASSDAIKTKKYLQLKENGLHYETMITGRKLLGQPVQMQGNTQAQVWKKQAVYRDDEEEDVFEWKKTAIHFDTFVFWKKDTMPSKEDARLGAIEHWLDISRSIHEPIP